MSAMKEFAGRYVERFRKDDVTGIAAELAYRFLFAIFPFGIFVVALGATLAAAVGIDNPAERAVSALGDNLPAALAGTVQGQLQAVIDQTRPTLLSFGALAALYAATGGTNALIKAMNRAYDVQDTRGFVGRLVLAVGLTLLGSIGLIASFVTIVGGTVLTEQLAAQIGFTRDTWNLVTLLRWPLVFVILTVAVALLFRLAPNVTPPWRWIIAGAVLFAAAWLLVTFAFAVYVANFANYASTYGALGGVMALMLWFYLTSIVLVGAAEFVAVGTALSEPERLQARRDELAFAKAASDGARRAIEATKDGVRTAGDGVARTLNGTATPGDTTGKAGATPARIPRSSRSTGGARPR